MELVQTDGHVCSHLGPVNLVKSQVHINSLLISSHLPKYLNRNTAIRTVWFIISTTTRSFA